MTTMDKWGWQRCLLALLLMGICGAAQAAEDLARDPAQAVEARQDHVPGATRTGGKSYSGTTGGGQQPALVVQQR